MFTTALLGFYVAEANPGGSIAGGIPWNNLGVVGLCAAMAVTIITGRLIPKSTVDKLVGGLESRNQFLEQTIVSMQEVKQELASQNRELLGTARLSAALLETVHPEGRGGNVPVASA